MTQLRPENRHEAFEILGADRRGPWLVTCDHATNRVPEWLGGSLGIAAEDMMRHIAFDVGARGLAIALGEALESPVLCSDFSRLVIDPNRGEDDPTLIMKLYDGTIIPANRHVGPSDVEMRLNRLYRPYHDAYARISTGKVILAIHSFTPNLMGRSPRPWHVGVLYSHLDDRLSRAVIAGLQEVPDWCVGDNEPYSGHLPGDAIDRHALAKGRHNTLIELRNDLIATEADQSEWAHKLAPILISALRAVAPA